MMNGLARTVKKPALIVLIALMLLVNNISLPMPIVTALASNPLTASAVLASSIVEAGTGAAVNVSVKATDQTDVLIDVEFFDSSLKNVGKVFVDHIKLEAGVERTVPLVWQVPANLPAGQYLVSFGIFGAGWGSGVSKWFPGAATLTVTGGAPVLSFSSQALASPSSAMTGGEVSIDASVTASESASVLVEVSIVEPSGTKAKIQSFTESFAAAQTKHFPLAWTIPANAQTGNYKVEIGVFSPDRTKSYMQNQTAAQFSVGSASQPVPAIPANVKAAAGAAEVTVTWDAAEHAISYDIEIDGTLVNDAGTASYVHKGLQPDSEHTYKVRGKNGSIVGPWSGLVKAKVLPAGNDTEAIKVVTATGNNAKTSSISTKFKVANKGKTPIQLKDLRIRYYFTADFAGEDEKEFAVGFYSMVKWRTVLKESINAQIVKMPIPSADATHYLEIGFTEQSGAIPAGEELAWNGWFNKSDWSSFNQANDYSYLHSSTEQESSKTIVYKDGTRTWGVEPVLLDMPSFPVNVKAAPNDTSITLTWDAVEGATGYEVYADGVTTNVADPSYGYDYLKPGTLHTFKLRTIKDQTASLWSSALTVKTTGEQQLPAPSGIRAEKTESSIKVTWRALQELVTGYDIEIDGTVMPLESTLFYTHSGLTPASLHTYRVRAKDGSTLGPWSDRIKINTLRTPTAAFDVDFRIDPTAERAPISPYIYGSNEDLTGTENLTARRAGGNRFSAYNWENNASNSGDDAGFVSDSFVPWYYGGIPVSESAKWNIPGSAAIGFHQKSLEKGAYTLWTLPTAGYAAKDKNARVTKAETAPSNRWIDVKAAKGSPFSLSPDLNDNVAYNDEFVNLMVNRFGLASSGTGINGYSIDNEPGLWKKTHAYMHPEATKGAEVLSKSVDLAKAVKQVDPSAEMFGPVSYGFSDAYMVDNKQEWEQIKGNYRWYLDYYLDNMARESRKEGKRLLDVLDIHWYSEEMGGGTRITSTALDKHNLETHKVRVQAPRSLWDPSYREKTWIGDWYSEFLPLIPAMKKSINTYNEGTKMAFTEYDFGGSHHVSGGIAQADTLGVFGKQGLYMANYWNMAGTSRLSQIPYLSSGFRIFNNYDGSHSKYGDTKVAADTNDIENSSIYSSVFKDSDNNLHMIAINKNFDYDMNASFTIGGDTAYQSARVWAFDESSPAITERAGVAEISGNTFTLSIPKLTVAHIVLSAESSS
ncbi:glycoside hydrolase family 44 protein [Paenibacillus sp. 2TAB23]|uniref:glycoside hydrolase family 44 protein n=1 Tax=Paenibacillus sp. 2TAB23 TaxID=3233004 RepID=UPI003F9D0AFF